MGGHPSWEDPPTDLCKMHTWYERAYDKWITAKRELSLKVHLPGHAIRSKKLRNVELPTDPYPNPNVQWLTHTNRLGCLDVMGSYRAELRPTGSCGAAPSGSDLV